MSTVVQAAEHIVVESATAVVTQVAKSTAGDLKTIESSVVKEAVSATDETVPSLLDKVQDGLQDVADEVVKGAEAAVESVKEHPELVAEGALAVVIGAASLIQPEFAAGEIALIGKMAADSARKGVTDIATETSTKVVKAISKDLADDAQEEQAKDATDKVAREKAKAATNGVVASPADPDAKAPIVALTKDGTNGSVPNPSGATSASVAKVSEIQTTKVESKVNVSSPPDPKTVSASDASPKDKTIAIQVAQESSQTTTNAKGASPESKTEPPVVAPVSFKITLGADGEVKSVTKGSEEPKSVTTDPAATSTISKTTSVQTITKTMIEPTESPKENTLVATDGTTNVTRPSPSPEKPEAVSEIPQIATDSSQAKETPPKTGPVESESTTLPQNKPETLNETPHLAQEISKASALPIVSTVATIVSTSKSKTTADTAPQGTPTATDSPNMVTVSQESLDLLHHKLDRMHEAIQQITKVLALHMPTPPSGAPGPSPFPNAEAVINEAMATAVRPLSELVPEILGKNDDSSHPPLEDPSAPKSSSQRPGLSAEKRASLLGSIGKVLWPFSSEKLTTVTVTEVSSHRVEAEV